MKTVSRDRTIKALEEIWGVSFKGWKISVKPKSTGTLGGWCDCLIREIMLYPWCSDEPEYIRILLVHELAHACDSIRSGGEYRRTKTGRLLTHDKIFRSILQEVEAVRPSWVQNLSKRGLRTAYRRDE